MNKIRHFWTKRICHQQSSLKQSKKFVSGRSKMVSAEKSEKQGIIKNKESGKYMDKCKQT